MFNPPKVVRTVPFVALLGGLVLSLVGSAAYAQTTPAARTTADPTLQQGEPPYRREFTYGVSSNSNSGLIAGGMIRSTRYWKPDWYWFWMLEINEVKNRKEVRVLSAVTGDQYIYGKANYLYALRPSVGLERIIFHKAAEQGVQVSALLSGGPSIGFEVPYYIYYDYDQGTNLPLVPVDVRREPYDPTGRHINPNRVVGGASFTTGLSEAKVIPGVHLRGGLAFEYGRYREGVTGLEAGVMVEAYGRRPNLVPAAANPRVFTGVYLTLFMGRRS